MGVGGDADLVGVGGAAVAKGVGGAVGLVGVGGEAGEVGVYVGDSSAMVEESCAQIQPKHSSQKH